MNADMRHCSIAIDGPSGAGKSTIARAVAGELGIVYVDTGAIYRTVGLFAREKGIPRDRIEDVVPLLDGARIDLDHGEDGLQRIYLDGRDVSQEIRQPEISLYASDVSRLPEVRAFLLEMQRDLARRHSVIMDGRDIGTVVLPDADVKIFLTATAEDRALRRWRELRDKGADDTYEEVLADMRYRDAQDAGRAVAPLKPAEDAVVLDTTGNTLEQSIALLSATIREKLGL